ncbi:MAG TPA: 3-dehydroquinate synthase, partial [Tetragenococcus sp.]|nr:3-dehydroquinate synthase [Tetragenococcus sp.]
MKLTINLKDHAYDILIRQNSLAQCGQWVRELWQPKKIAIITDSNVRPLYARIVASSLEKAGFTCLVLEIAAGEASKSLEKANILYQKLAAENFSRSDGIIALGGGVIGDLAGFVASTYMRGIPFLQIPTSLLAQVDSSIGGKTAVNTPWAKNLIGSFYQPEGVLIDTTVLSTLSPRRLREGTAEIIKSAAIGDRKLWELLDTLPDETALLQRAEEVIIPTLKVKRKVVEEDEFDQGNRLILNFGHTIGHAIEKTAGYGVVSHGEGVAIGMIQITKAAEKMQETPAGIMTVLQRMLEKFN